MLQEQSEREHLQLEITQRIRQSLDLQTIFDTACQEIRQVLESDRVGIFKFNQDSNCNEGIFIAESVVEGYPSALQAKVHDHCFGETYASRYTQGHYYAVDDINTTKLEPCHREMLTQFAIHAHLIMPLCYGEVLWGLLCIHQCSGPRQWQADNIEITRQLSNQLAIAIQQADLYQQGQSELVIRQQTEATLASQLAQQQTLASISERIRQSLNLEEILAIVTQQVKDIMQCDRVSIFRVQHEAPSYVIEEAVEPDLPTLKAFQWEDERWSPDVLELYWRGTPRIVPDALEDAWSECLVSFCQDYQIQSKIVACTNNMSSIN